MRSPETFDAYYVETRTRLLHEAYALTGDAPASRAAVRDAFVVAWHRWRKVGQLEDRDGTWFAVIDLPGRATAAVLAEAVAGIVRDFPWPKSMRWGAASASTASLRWVRPLHAIVALLGEDIVPVEIDGGIDLLHDGIRAGAEAPAPHLIAHGTSTEVSPRMTAPTATKPSKPPLSAASAIAAGISSAPGTVRVST